MKAMLFMTLLFGMMLAIQNPVTYRIGPEDAENQILFYDPTDPNHLSEKIFIGSDPYHYFLIEVEYNIYSVIEFIRHWLYEEEWGDFNQDGCINFCDLAFYLYIGGEGLGSGQSINLSVQPLYIQVKENQE